MNLVCYFGFVWLKVSLYQDNAPQKKYLYRGSTSTLIIHLTKNMHIAEKVVVLVSGLYALQGLVDINNKEVYGSTLIKKS